MPVQEQRYVPSDREPFSFYAYCELPQCGVCGPLRRFQEDARWDEMAHGQVCSETRVPAGKSVDSGVQLNRAGDAVNVPAHGIGR